MILTARVARLVLRAKYFVIAIVSSCILLPSSRCLAWHDSGHQIVALIAFERMSPEARDQVLSILKAHERYAEDFDAEMPSAVREAGQGTQDRWVVAQAATWPDFVRPFLINRQQIPERARFHRGPWHYINLPYYLTDEDRLKLEGHLNDNLEQDLPEGTIDELMANDKLNAIQALKLCVKVLKSDSATPQQRAIAMCWLFHVVGDIHQPNHAAALFTSGRFPDGDRGANEIPVKQQQKLHRLWDGLLGSTDDFNTVRGRAVGLYQDKALATIGEKAAGQLDFWTWAEEGLDISKAVVYSPQILDVVRAGEQNPKEPLSIIDLDREYLEQAGGVARQRVVEAGYRLGALLNQLYSK